MKTKGDNPLKLQRVLIDTIPVPVFYKDTAGRYLGCNSAFEKFFGAERGALIGKTVFEITTPELAEVYHRRDLELFQTRHTGL